MMDAYAPSVDPGAAALSRLLTVVAEDAIFGLSAALGNASDALEELGKRRKDVYAAVAAGKQVTRMTESFDQWVVEMTRAMAPVCPPSWMPMAEVLREKVTLEIGARGLRSLFSSKPSDKDVQRVKRLGTLAVRLLRAVFAADGPVDAEEARTLAAVIGSLGLPEADAAPLYTEAPVAIEQIELYGEIEPAVARAMLRGAWLAAAWDALDPREELVIRAMSAKLNVQLNDVEYMRNEAIARVDARRMVGLATVDAVRFMLSDRVPGPGQKLPADAGALMLPRRYREEALAQVAQNAPVTLAQRYKGISGDEKTSVLGIAWAAALVEDPTMSRKALLRARLDRLAQDLGEKAENARRVVDEMAWACLADAAAGMVRAS